MVKTLKQYRIERMSTVRSLAAAAGISPTTLVAIEHGRVRPHYGTMLAVASALGVEVREVTEFAAALDAKLSNAA